MERDVAVNKVLRDLKASGLIDPIYASEVRPFLEQLWVVCWEKTKKDLLSNNKKKVAQYSSDGRLLNTFVSIESAAKITGHNRRNIYNSIVFERKTRKGYKWLFVNEKINGYPGPF